MKKNKKELFMSYFKATTASLFALMLFAVTAAEARVAAKFESLSGGVQYREKRGQWKNASIGTPLTSNTELQTGPRGRATLVFPNGSRVSLAPGTLASLDQYTSGSYGTQTNMSLRVGRMHADIAKVNDANVRNHFRVRTPTVVAGVRGTIEDIGHSPDKGSDVTLHESSADVIDGNGKKSNVPQGGASKVTHSGTSTADQQQAKKSTVTMVGGGGSTPGEAEMSMTAGDFTFSSNQSDFDDLFDLFDLFDYYDSIGTTVTFQKL
jgi:hypothetical protein